MKWPLSAILYIMKPSCTLNAWIAHHVAEGIEHIYLLCEDTNTFQYTIKNHKDKVFIILKSENNLNDLTLRLKDNSDWIFLATLDKYLYFKGKGLVIDYLKSLPDDIETVFVPEKEFNNEDALSKEDNMIDTCVKRIQTTSDRYLIIARSKLLVVEPNLELKLLSGKESRSNIPLAVNKYCSVPESLPHVIDCELKNKSHIRKFTAHYGIYDYFKNVSQNVMNLEKDGMINIKDPYNNLFGDPIYGQMKYLVIKHPYLMTSIVFPEDFLFSLAVSPPLVVGRLLVIYKIDTAYANNINESSLSANAKLYFILSKDKEQIALEIIKMFPTSVISDGGDERIKDIVNDFRFILILDNKISSREAKSVRAYMINLWYENLKIFNVLGFVNKISLSTSTENNYWMRSAEVSGGKTFYHLKNLSRTDLQSNI